jgi:type I restriction enzyme S subunit
VLVRGMTLMKEVPVGVTVRESAFNQDVKALLPDRKRSDVRFLGYFLRCENHRLRNCVTTAGHGTGRLPLVRVDRGISNTSPPLHEQRKIADILGTWDEALENLDVLISAKDRRKQALMQQLLTGKRRLKEFDESKGLTKRDRFGIYPADWNRRELGEITCEVSARNADCGNMPVLSCAKHHGLVPSEEYFGKKIYADDTSTSNYRVVRRSEFAYATNHIEEGSLGYQDICDAGLVSPIYTVFKTTAEVDDTYLYRVLKSPLLIHLYRVNISASVDRRGSLRNACGWHGSINYDEAGNWREHR